MASTWKTVRIFISSTFRDMHAERDHLVKVVFPELRERMAQRHLHLVDIDLRWGVTEAEAEQGKLLDIILDEIDRSRPFFIAILGERYGSIPDKVPEDTRFAYPWLSDHPDHSLTALEIIHGVLRNPDLAARSFFYFRNPQFISQVPGNRRADFAAENTEAATKLAALKNKIRASGRPLMENYPCRWDDAEGRVVDLDAFGQQVLEDLWTAIGSEYPVEPPEPDPLTIERQMHEAFVEERSRLHIGREEQAARLTAYVQGKDRRPVVITGESGCGKSAFLTSWYRKYSSEHPDDFVLAYFIGASPNSTNHYHLLRNMCEELKRNFALKEEIPQEDKKLSETLVLLLFAASRDKTRIVILLDALDQLSQLEGAHGLGWLLDYMPEKARLVVSSLEGDCLEVLRRREAEEITLPPLTENEQHQIVQALLEEWRRKLDEKQMKALLAHPGVKNPLYLRVALEELRLFGIFELLTERIETLAHDIPGLFDQVLARLEKDHGSELVAETFTLLGCSRYGLSEKEMLELLRREGEEQLPRAVWARLARSAKAYLVQRGEFLGFFHRQLADAVAARYLSRENKHAKLAAYFENAPLERKLDEYPYQLKHSGQMQKLSSTLCDADIFTYAMEQGRDYEWIGYWQILKGDFDPEQCYEASTEARWTQEGESQSIARLLNHTSRLFELMGLYRTALKYRQRSFAILEKNLGHDDPNLAPHLDNLASIYLLVGRYREAEESIQAVRGATSDTDDPDTAIYLSNRVMHLKEQGRALEAIPIAEKALKITERAKGINSPNMALMLLNISSLYYDVGDLEKALALNMRALKIEENVKGHAHPDVGQCLNNLAFVHMSMENYEEARTCFERSLTILQSALGQNHPNVADIISNIGLCCQFEGNYDQALQFLQKALSIKEEVLGEDHPHVGYVLFSMAYNLAMRGKLTEAESCCKRAVFIAEKAFGYNHPKTQLYLERLKAIEEVRR